MTYTRREIIDDFLNHVGAGDDPKARVRAERVLNRVVQHIWGRKMFWNQFQVTSAFQIATVIGQRAYPLPTFFGRISSVDDRLTNVTARCEITAIGPGELTELDPTQGTADETAGSARQYYLGQSVGVARQPASALDIEVLSSSGADTNVNAFIEGYDANGDEVRAQVLLVGIAPVPLGTFARITKVSKAYPAGLTPPTVGTSSVGTITFRTTVGAIVLQTLFPSESAREHQELVLYPWPAAAESILVPYVRRPAKLINDADTIPADWELAIIEGMEIAWRSGDGEIVFDNGIARPRLEDLICLDNGRQPRKRSRPFAEGYF